MAATCLIRLGKLCGRTDFLEKAWQTMTGATGILERNPAAAGQMLIAADYHFGPTQELVLIADGELPDNAAIIDVIRTTYLPRCVITCRHPDRLDQGSPHLHALYRGRRSEGEVALFVCENSVCEQPVHGHEAVLKRISALASTDGSSRPT